MNRYLQILILCALAASAQNTIASAPPERASAGTRGGDFATAQELAVDIREMLEPKLRRLFPPSPVIEDLQAVPAARPVAPTETPDQIRGVVLTAGFIEFANRVTHAWAIDKVEPGYLDRYLALLSRQTDGADLPPLPDGANAAYWTEQIRNAQLSAFNQIVGMVVSVNLAHHHLGQYEKHASKLHAAGGGQLPLASVLSKGEWLKAMRTGTQHSLDAGLGMTGYIAFCEAIDGMETRPTWTEYFLPRDMKASKIRSELRILEAKFFSGRSIKDS
jgi:hypothetical protein